MSEQQTETVFGHDRRFLKAVELWNDAQAIKQKLTHTLESDARRPDRIEATHAANQAFNDHLAAHAKFFADDPFFGPQVELAVLNASPAGVSL